MSIFKRGEYRPGKGPVNSTPPGQRATKRLKLRLTLDIDYKPNTTSEQRLRGYLESMVHHATYNGVITGTSDAEMVTERHTIHRLDIVKTL